MKMKVQIVVDNPLSWVIPKAKNLIAKINKIEGVEGIFKNNYEDIEEGDILVLLSCEKIVSQEILKKNTHNLVIHASALPKGKGWSPLTWQILEGKNDIPVTLIEAVEKVDAGMIYDQIIVKFRGDELIEELRNGIHQATEELITNFIRSYPNVSGTAQIGDSTYYKRRKSSDSELNPHQTIAEQFNFLRTVDNEKYPAYFIFHGCKYSLIIKKISF